MKVWSSETLTASDMTTYLTNNIEYLYGASQGVTFQAVRLGIASSQAISTSSATNVSFDTEIFDFGGWWSSGTAVTVPAAAVPSGYTTIAVLLLARGRFASNTTGYRRLRINVNGTTVASTSVDAVSSAETEVAVTDMTTVSAGDVITLEAYQTSGGNLNLEVGNLVVARYAPAA